MDADDLAFPDRLQLQVDYLDQNSDIDLLGTRAVVFAEPNLVVGLLPFRQTHAELTSAPWNNIALPHPTWMGRKKWFTKHPYRLREVKRAEDQELLLRAMDDSRYACLPDVLLAYRQGRSNLTKTLVARRYLLAAQVRIFTQRCRHMDAIRAIGYTGLKTFIDLVSALTGGNRPLGNRLQLETIPPKTLATLDKLLKSA
jgi:hypothetical protein